MAFKPIEIVVNAKDQASSVFAKLGTAIAGVGATVAAYFGAKKIAEFFSSAVSGAAEFESAMSRVKAASGASADQLAALQKAAEDAGANTAFTSVQAAGALENLAKAGLSAEDSIAALGPVLDMATAGDLDLANAAEYVTKAVMGMGLSFADTARVTDVLAAGANATNTSIEGLSQALSFAAPVASAMGLSLESTVGILGKLADAGIDASRSGTALNSILSQFADSGSAFRRELSAAGITTSNFEEALHQLAAAGQGGDKAILAVGRSAGPALRALLGQGMGALDDLTDGLRNAQGSAAAMAATMADNLQGSVTGLGSAWDALKTTLGTPVLPVLKDGVDQLAAAFRSAVGDGTIEKLGQAVATAFEGGLKWVRGFLAEFNFDAATARLTEFAQGTQETLAKVGEWATKAGNTAKLAWGVMAGGTNMVLAIVYKLGEAFAGVASNIQSGLALIMDGVAKVTFGDLSASFKAAAAEIRTSAEATWAASQALADKASDAFDRAGEHAQTARDGWRGLTGAVDESAAAMGKLGTAATDAAGKLGPLAQAAEAAADKIGQAAQAQRDAATASGQAAAAHAALRAEYQQAIEAGNVQRAAELMQQLRKTTDNATDAQNNLGVQAKASADRVAAAFAAANLKTKAELQSLAQTARQDFDAIKQSGKATSDTIAQAWKRAAQAALDAADNGTVPAWVQSEAAAHGYTVAVDEAGKATLEAANKAKEGGRRTANAWRDAKGAADDYRKSAPGKDAANDAADAHKQAGDTIKRVWVQATDEASQYANAAKQAAWAMRDEYQQAFTGIGLAANGLGRAMNAMANQMTWLNQQADNYINTMERLDAQVQQLNASQSGTAQSIDQMRLRLLELSGTEAEVAKARLQRDLAEIDRQIKLAEIERERAAVEKDHAKAEEQGREIARLKELAKLTEQVHKAEQKQADQAKKDASTTGGNTASRSGGMATGGAGQGSGPSYVTNVTLDGRQHRITTSDPGSQNALTSLLRELANAQKVAA